MVCMYRKKKDTSRAVRKFNTRTEDEEGVYDAVEEDGLCTFGPTSFLHMEHMLFEGQLSYFIFHCYTQNTESHSIMVFS